MSTKIIAEDMEYILRQPYIPWEKLKDSRILVTGATGLICSTTVKALLYANQKNDLNCKICCLVRDPQKAAKIFADAAGSPDLSFISGSVEAPLQCDMHFDYIIHGASPTASRFFVEQPVETMQTAINGTQNMLERAKADGAKGFLYLSSMEAYGHVSDETVLTEDVLGGIDLSSVRSSYPESKRVCELLCRAYAAEYQVPAKCVRLAQTFGAGVSIDDKRVFAMMARCALNKEDIVLLTKGTSKHPYLYTAQAVTAMLCILLNGEAGETYNAANPETYCSIYEMGVMVAHELANDEIRVVIQESDANKMYPAAGYLNLSVEKLKALGWQPEGTLKDIYSRMMADMTEKD